MESNVVNSPRAFTSSSVPNSSSTKAKSVTLATESHSAVFVVFAFARALLGSAGNTEEDTSSSDFARRPFVFSLSLTDSFRCPFARLHLFMATAWHHHQKGMHTMPSRSRASDEALDHAPCTSMDKPGNLANKASTAGTFA